jgi:hypothetical protein
MSFSLDQVELSTHSRRGGLSWAGEVCFGKAIATTSVGEGVLPVKRQHSALRWPSPMVRAAPLENVVDVCGSFLGFGYVVSVMLLSVLMVFTCFSQAQKITSHKESGFQFPDAPSAVLRVSDVPKDLHIFDKSSTLHLRPDANNSSWWMSSSWNGNRATRSPHTIRDENTRMAELFRRDEHLVLGARAGWLTFVSSYGHLQPSATHNVDDWQHFGYQIPLAGSVVLRVAQEAQAHPRLVSIFKIIQPHFGDSGTPSRTKGRGRPPH